MRAKRTGNREGKPLCSRCIFYGSSSMPDLLLNISQNQGWNHVCSQVILLWTRATMLYFFLAKNEYVRFHLGFGPLKMLEISISSSFAAWLRSGHSQHSCKYRFNDLASLQDFNMENESINNDDCPRFRKNGSRNQESEPTYTFMTMTSISGLAVE